MQIKKQFASELGFET